MQGFCGRALSALVLMAMAASASSQTTTYRYDALGRVVRSAEGDGRAVAYDYDAAGNRVSLSNGAPSLELSVKAFSASSNAGGFTGLTATGAMRDQVFNAKATSHVTLSEASAWIQADLGAGQSLDRVDLAGPDAAVVAGGAAVLSGAVIETSDDAQAWTVAATLGTVSPGVYKTVNLGGARARYVRVRRASGLVGVGDFRLYSGGQRSNRSPVTVDDQLEVLKGQTLVFDPRANDKDLDGDALSLSAAGSGAAHGQVTFTASAITYKPDTTYVGVDSFSYAVVDTYGASATGKVTVTVKDVANRPPIVQDLGAATEVGVAAEFSVVAADPDNDPLSLGDFSSTSGGGVITPLGGLRFRYAPTPNFTGTDNFAFEVRDGRGGVASGRASISVMRYTSTNHDPVAFDDVTTTSKGQALIYNPRGNDTDVDRDILTITAVQGVSAQGGAVTRATDGASLTYTPPNGAFVGQDWFTYTVGDSRGGTSSAKVTVNVIGSANTAPTASSDGWMTSINATVGADVRQNDGDQDGDLLTITSVTQPAHGTAGIYLSGKWITYTPEAGYVGGDSFSYTISDGRGGTAAAAVSITVKGSANQPPVVPADPPIEYTIPPNQSFTFDLTTWGSDPDGDLLTVISADLDSSYPDTYPVKGTLSRSSAGPTNDELLTKLMTYTPPAGESGFTVKGLFLLYDGHGGGTSAVRPFTLHVSSAASVLAPVAQPAAMRVAFEGQKTANLQALGSYTSLEVAQQPAAGSAVITGTVVTYSAPPGYSGDADFTIRARGAGGIGPAATVDVTVGPNNATPPPSNNANPVAVNDTVSDVAYGTPRAVYVLGNDSDPNGDPLTINPALPQGPGHGQAQVSGSAIIYTPASGYAGSDNFVYGISDGKGGAATATVSLTVLPQANRAPVAVSDSVSVTFGQAKAVAALTNDYDPDGDTVLLNSAGGASHGGVVVAGGALTYTPTAGYSGPDGFSYTIVDGRGGSATGSVTVTVLPAPNTSPSAVADSYAIAFNSQAFLAVRDNDGDPDGDPLTLVSVGLPAHGTAVIANGVITYTPTGGYSGADGFSYTISDGRGGSATANIAITVKPKPNQAPVAVADSIATDAGAVRSINVLANDSDPDGDPLTLTSVTVPAHGSAVIASGQITYAPTSGYVGSDSFGYTVSDGRGASASASVSVNVQPANRVPSAVNDTASIAFNTAKTIAVLTNDSDPDGDTLTIAAVASPGHGTAVIAGGQVIYTPTTGYSGSDSFGYTISDGRSGTATASVGLTVDARPNQVPSAASDTVTVTFNTAKTIAVLANDSDADGDVLTLASVTTPGHGAAVIANGQVTYTPASGYAGADSFSYTVSDGYGGSASATVGITVQPANQAPVAVNDAATTPFNTAKTIAVLANDSDADGDVLTLASVTTPGHGAAVIANGQVTYTPAAGYSGPDGFSYTVSDGSGATATATVSVTVQPGVNHAPVAANDTFYVPNDANTLLPVLDNDRDDDGDVLTLEVIVAPEFGTAIVQNGMVLYRPTSLDESTGESFRYQVSDGRGGVATAWVYIGNVGNHWPVARDDGPITVATGKAAAVTVLANDTDVDGNALQVTQASAPAHGQAVVSGKLVTYTATAGYVGSDSFTYTITDGVYGALARAKVTLNVIANRGPSAVNDAASTGLNIAKSIAVLANDGDPDGDVLTLASVTTPGHGAAVIANGQITYTPVAGYLGADSFDYTVSDGQGLSATATVSVTVKAANTPPTARTGYFYIHGAGWSRLYAPDYASDGDGDPLSVDSAWGATRGRLEVSGPYVIYIPNGLNADGVDTFSYKVTDGRGGYATSTMTVDFSSEDSNYMAPLAADDRFAVPKDVCSGLVVSTNDFLFNGNGNYSFGHAPPKHGGASIGSTGGVNYCPDAGYVGADSFEYSVNDGVGFSYATVYVTVGPVGNRPPKPGADTPTWSAIVAGRANTITRLLDNDSDPDGDALSLVSVQGAKNGSLALGPNNTVTFAPPAGFFGEDWFTYTVSDNKGGLAEAAVYVNINPNRPPTAGTDSLSAKKNQTTLLDVLVNDTDGNGDKLTLVSVSTPSQGGAVIQDGKVAYTPPANYTGFASFTYKVSDGFGLEATGSVGLSVIP